MNKQLKFLVIGGAIFLLIVIIKPFYIVKEGDQAVVTRVGKLVNIETEAGLKVKIPGVDKVQYYTKRIVSWDGDPRKILTEDEQYVWVDTTARWRITDPALFYESVRTENGAQGKLDDVIESALKTIISKYPLGESVRSTNNIITSQEKIKEEAEIQSTIESSSYEISEDDSIYKPIQMGRQKLSDEMREYAKDNAVKYGIELLDIVIRQIRYSDELTESVYVQMIQERASIAETNRSSGQGERERILGEMIRDKETTLSNAERKAEAIKGAADAEAALIYAKAYGQDREFYNFWRAMESYKKTLPELNKTLSTEIDYFDYLYDMN